MILGRRDKPSLSELQEAAEQASGWPACPRCGRKAWYVRNTYFVKEGKRRVRVCVCGHELLRTTETVDK